MTELGERPTKEEGGKTLKEKNCLQSTPLFYQLQSLEKKHHTVKGGQKDKSSIYTKNKTTTRVE